MRLFWNRHQHIFGKWEMLENGQIGVRDDMAKIAVIGRYVEQKRVCSECGFVEIHMQQIRL